MSRTEDLLVETARRGELHHSIILHGPDAARMRELALRIARALNCPAGSGDDECLSCSRIARGAHPDVHLVEVAENRKMIAVEQIRTMVTEAASRPYEGKCKVFIIDGAETVSGAGANALLKTLEEPSRETVFILLARSADLLLPTIRSRSQAISIQPAFSRSPREEAERSRVPLQLARLRQEITSLPGLEGDEAEALARQIVAAIAAWAAHRDAAALLGAASAVAAGEPAGTLPLLALTLRDLAAIDPEDSFAPDAFREIRAAIPQRTILEAAEVALRNATRLAVNADAKLLAEQAVLALTR